MTSIVYQTLAPVADALERVGARYRIGGSVASSALGVPRATIDVDLVAELRPEHVEPFASALEATFYVDREMIRGALRLRDEFNVISDETLMKVDVFLVGTRPFDRAAFERVVETTLADAPDARRFPMSSAEDVVLHKLDWHRMGGGVSDRQWGDAVGILAVREGRLDETYLDRWAKDLELDTALARARADARVAALPQR